MVFKRRDKPPLLSRIRHAVLPRTGWRRSFEYLGHRVRRLPDSPHRISLGLACGTFVTFTPLFGLHFLLAALAAKIARANILASLIGTAVGNPLTFPFIASLSLGLGRQILGYGVTGRDFGRVAKAFEQFFIGLWQSFWSLFGYGEPQWHKVTLFIQDVWWPYCVGGILPGIASGVLVYYLSRPLITAYQARRRAKTLERARKIRQSIKSESDVKKRSPYSPANSGTTG